MAKKKVFKEITDEEFEKLSPEDQSKYLMDLDAAKAKKADEEEDESAEAKMKERAEEYFESNPEYPHTSVYVSSDLNVFHGNLKGRNAVANHVGTLINGSFKEYLKS